MIMTNEILELNDAEISIVTGGSVASAARQIAEAISNVLPPTGGGVIGTYAEVIGCGWCKTPQPSTTPGGWI